MYLIDNQVARLRDADRRVQATATLLVGGFDGSSYL
jgi:hypothetical protein